jgi:hypothetical protein
MQTLWQDIRYGLRGLLKRPGFTAITVITLAPGIGTTAAIFSMVNAVLLRPLPFDSFERLVVVRETLAQGGTGPGSGPNFQDWRNQESTFAALAVYLPDGVNLIGPTSARRIEAALVSKDFFAAFRQNAVRGRLFSPEELQPAGSPVAVISESLWRNSFGADPNFVGNTINLSGESYTVIGMIPANFHFPEKNRSLASREIQQSIQWKPWIAFLLVHWAAKGGSTDCKNFIPLFRPAV